MGFDYPKTSRLLTPSDFKQVFDRVQYKASSRYFTLLARDTTKPSPRLGFVISKKQVKQAVQRNRIKRLTRECFRLQQAELPAIDVIFLGRKGLSELDNSEFDLALIKSLKKLTTLYNKH